MIRDPFGKPVTPTIASEVYQRFPTTAYQVETFYTQHPEAFENLTGVTEFNYGTTGYALDKDDFDKTRPQAISVKIQAGLKKPLGFFDIRKRIQVFGRFNWYRESVSSFIERMTES